MLAKDTRLLNQRQGTWLLTAIVARVSAFIPVVKSQSPGMVWKGPHDTCTHHGSQDGSPELRVPKLFLMDSKSVNDGIIFIVLDSKQTCPLFWGNAVSVFHSCPPHILEKIVQKKGSHASAPKMCRNMRNPWKMISQHLNHKIVSLWVDSLKHF